MRRHEADPDRGIVAPAHLDIALEIQDGDARGSILTPRRRHERKQRGPLTELGHVDVARVVDAHVIGAGQIVPFVEILAVQVEDLDPIVLAIAHQDALVSQHQHGVGNVEMARLAAGLAPRGAQLTLRREVMHAGVAIAI